MKHFMLPRNTFFKEMNPLSEISSPNPNSHKQKPLRRQKCPKDKENSDPTTTVPDSVAGKPSPAGSGKLKSPLPPRPPSSNPLKRKLSVDAVSDVGGPCSSSDSGVRVIVRMRPLNKDEEVGEMIVQKLSNDSLSINGHNFTFDSVADTEATQQDIFQLVGAPLVENCLAGFNSSVFAYGQTGSGKTYTMWGPANALSEENLLNDQQGLTPRVLERLFARIHEEQVKHADKQLTYQCRCSFLEIYNEQITDLLDPSQKNLQIREDTKSGVYVENLREECVLTMKDVIHLLLKGLANRRTGATSINAESSRSHSVFTCVVESHCKGVSDGKSSFKTSRINLVDLAGSERQKLTGAAGERLKEAGNINRSLSQLGNLINILAEVSQTGKQRHIPYRDSRLTFLLQESLGGNAKMAMICAISPAQSCKSETFSTLRFAQRAKAIKNKAVVNEVVENDVNFLREVIRQLKDELVRLRANSQHSDPTAAYSNGWSARRSLNLLKLSLSRQMMFPRVDDDGDEEMEIDEEAVEQICNQANLGPMDADGGRALENGCIDKQASEIPDVSMEEATPEIDHSTMRGSSCWNEEPGTDEKVTYDETPGKTLGNDSLAPNLSIVPSDVSPELKSPPLSVSPKVISSSRKSLRTSEKIPRNSGIGRENIQTSVSNVAKKSFSSALTALSGNKGHLTSDHLAASIHRGLEIFDSHRKSSIFGRSSFRFNPAEMKPVLPVEKVEVGVQTLPETDETMEENTVIYLCSDCKSRNLQGDPKEANDTSCLQLVPVDGSLSVEKSKKQVPKAVEKVLAGAIRREMALEDFCSKQTSEIAQLNRLVQQYKHERECNAIIGQMREDKIAQLENLMDGVLPTEEFMEEELASLIKEHELLKEKYDNHPEVLRANIELKHVQDELERYRNFFDLGERDVLVEEVQDLRSQLQYYIDSSSKSAPQRRSLLKLTYSCEPSSSPPLSAIPESTEESAEVKLERERTKWTEVESQWISLADELKMELESSRSLAEKLKRELESEKNCSDELKEAMQLAMEGHARMLEQYADLEEKHMQLLARHRKIQEGIDDVKRAASKAGVKGAESKFINALAGEISALKVEREKERRYMRDEKKALQAQLRDTVEAVQAAGELLVRLKEAEEAVAAAERRATKAEEETEKMCKNIDKLKKKHEREMATLNQTIEESRLPKDTPQDSYLEPNSTKYDTEECQDTGDERWKEEFKDFFDADTELSKFGEPTSWFSGYDRCNI